jgi:hypothetical protein
VSVKFVPASDNNDNAASLDPVEDDEDDELSYPRERES